MNPTDRQDPSVDSQDPHSERRRYEKPELKDFGRLTELTRNTVGVGMGDGAQAGSAKTAGV